MAGPKGRRTVPVDQFNTGPGRNVLELGEFVVALRFPPPAPNSGAAWDRFIPRNEMDIAVVNAGVQLRFDGDSVSWAKVAIGAVAPGIRVLDPRMVGALGVTDRYLEREIAEQEAEIERRQRAYRGGRPPQPVEGRVAIVVDDGVATGSTAVAALRWARARGAERVVRAVPVAPPQSLERLRAEADEVVVLETPQPFLAVGEWYRDFDQTTDEQVVSALARSADARA